MKILFVSNDLIAGHLSHLLSTEGNDVKLYIDEVERRSNFSNMVTKTSDWSGEIKWLDNDGIIVFDDVGFGNFQDILRKEGFNVFGGSAGGDRLELDRAYGQEIFKNGGINIEPIINFSSIDDAIEYIKINPGAWVIKQNGKSSKSINYVGALDDGRDVIDVLNNYRKNNSHESEVISLQRRISGVEIAVTGYFNGKEWVGPALVNIEHKKFFPGDVGPTTSEMGTLGWYSDRKESKLFKETLEKLTGHLSAVNYRGIFDINCIVNDKGAFPLEATSRPGSPIIHLQTELNDCPWTDIINNVSRGKNEDVRHKDGFGIVVVIAIPPFPYSKNIPGHSQIGTPIYFKKPITKDDSSHIHFEEISINKDTGTHYISDDRGYVLYVTGHGKTVEDARKMAYSIIDKIHIPKMMYRNDIGTRFITQDQQKLKEWGYL